MTENQGERVRELANILSTFAHNCVAAATDAKKRNEFEHAREACAAFLLLRGHALVLVDLVAAGPRTYPSGWPIARVMLEAGARSAWRMDHDDPFVAEARWLAWLRRYARFERRRADWMGRQHMTVAAANANRRAAVFDQFCTDLARLLNERGVEVPDKEPPMLVVMQDLGLADRYQIYAEASERQHGSLLGLEAHTQNLGDQRRYGEFAQWFNWLPPLHAAMGGIQVLAQVFGRRTDTPSSSRPRTQPGPPGWTLSAACRRPLTELEVEGLIEASTVPGDTSPPTSEARLARQPPATYRLMPPDLGDRVVARDWKSGDLLSA